MIYCKFVDKFEFNFFNFPNQNIRMYNYSWLKQNFAT